MTDTPLVDHDPSVNPQETPKLSKDERRRAVERVADETRKIVLHNLEQATTEVDFLRWHRALTLATTPEMIDWMWDCGGVSAEDLVQDYQKERREQIFQKEGQALNELRQKLSRHPEKEGQVKFALKRMRDHSGRVEGYRVLAEFPPGYQDGDTIYFEPENACVIHACDDLYRLNKEQEGVAYIPASDYTTALGKIHGAEYMVEKTEEGKVTQDAGNYLLVALIGGFSNERLRVRISDFWRKQGKHLGGDRIS